MKVAVICLSESDFERYKSMIRLPGIEFHPVFDSKMVHGHLFDHYVETPIAKRHREYEFLKFFIRYRVV